jgi:hypothetical protein
VLRPDTLLNLNLVLNLVGKLAFDQICRMGANTGGIRQNLFLKIYYFEKLHAPHARGARARSRLARRSAG